MGGSQEWTCERIEKMREVTTAALRACEAQDCEWRDRMDDFDEAVTPHAVISLLDELERLRERFPSEATAPA